MKSLASKVKSLALASRPQVLENWPFLGSRTALFFELLKFRGALEKFFWKTFFCGDRLKNFREERLFFFFGDRPKKFLWRPVFFCRALALVSLVIGLGFEHSCPWLRECLSSERLSLASDVFCVLGLGLEPCVLDSTSAIPIVQNFVLLGILHLIDFCILWILIFLLLTMVSFLIFSLFEFVCVKVHERLECLKMCQ